MPKGRLWLGEQSDGNRKSENECLWMYVRRRGVSSSSSHPCQRLQWLGYHYMSLANPSHSPSISIHGRLVASARFRNGMVENSPRESAAYGETSP